MSKNIVKNLKEFWGGDGDFVSDLKKTEAFKPEKETKSDAEEHRVAMQVVPRVILSWLVSNLKEMKDGDSKEFKIPMTKNGKLKVMKNGGDDYSGDLHEGEKKKTEFRNRTLPSLGLVIMSVFEIYEIAEEKNKEEFDSSKIVEKVIEKLEIRKLVEEVVEKKISEKDAIKEIVKMKMLSLVNEPVDPREESKNKLKELIEKQGNIIELKIEKSEKAYCPSCGSNLVSDKGFRGCLCLGEDRMNAVSMKKTEEGVSLNLGKGWDPQIKALLVKNLKNKNNWR